MLMKIYNTTRGQLITIWVLAYPLNTTSYYM